MKHVLSVTEINKYISGIISKDYILSNIWVRGEISNYKYHYTGHMYFTLKDQNCVIKCVMFKKQAAALKFIPENGMSVIIRGYVSIFERDGQYQLYSEEMQPDGTGSLHLAFEQLKKRLEAEGVFNQDKKKKIPMLPERIGVITSTTGAVIKDIINVISRRFPNACLKIFPAAVQGSMAPAQIAYALEKLNSLDCVDVIIIARGGGSLEELWAFNEEIVARAVYKSHIPVISAVGHETDFTICDFAADLRAPTPSAAAEIVLPEKQFIKKRLKSFEETLQYALIKKLNISRMKVERLTGSVAFKQPYNRVYQERIRLDALNKDMARNFNIRINNTKRDLGGLIGKLDALSPLTVMARGYGVVVTDKFKLVKSINEVSNGDKIKIILKDGKLGCLVQEKDGGKEFE